MSRGPAPKPEVMRRRRNAPARGEWASSPGEGWQYGAIPEPPEGLMPASLTAWTTWMQSWVAAHWTPLDLPGLRTLIKLYDQVERGEYQRATELRLGMDTYGITPKGQQDRRWVAPKAEADELDAHRRKAAPEPVASPYAHLRVAK